VTDQTEREPATAWTPPPPGDRREQLPDHLLALIHIPSYLSTACETGQLLAWEMPKYTHYRVELGDHSDRLHARCRINNKFTGALCHCPCHDDAPEPAATEAAATEATDGQPCTRVATLYERWLAAGPPPLGTPMARWWDKRLAELHQVLSEQPRTTPNNPTTSSKPDTITDPEWLRQQYAAAIREHGLMHPDGRVFTGDHDCCADAVLRVRDRHLTQLRQRLALADAELQQRTAAEPADAAAGSYAGRAEEAEAVIERVRALAVKVRDRCASGSTDHKIGKYDVAVAILAELDRQADHADGVSS
jgi:hypothetical protein